MSGGLVMPQMGMSGGLGRNRMNWKRADKIRQEFFESKYPYPSMTQVARNHGTSRTMIRAIIRSALYPSRRRDHWWQEPPIGGPKKWGLPKTKEPAELWNEGIPVQRIADVLQVSPLRVKQMLAASKRKNWLTREYKES